VDKANKLYSVPPTIDKALLATSGTVLLKNQH